METVAGSSPDPPPRPRPITSPLIGVATGFLLHLQSNSSQLPPSLKRHGDIMAQNSFFSECFWVLTGEEAGEAAARVCQTWHDCRVPHLLQTPVSPLPLILLGSSLSQLLLPDAYHCGRSIKRNVCAWGIIGNMWRELKTLSHFKLPVICSKGACIVL